MSDRRALLARFSKLEAQRSALLRSLEKEAPQRLEQAPHAGAWSVAQVILHLAMADEGLIDHIDRKIAFGGHGEPSAGAPFRLALLKIALASPLKFKAPKVVATIPEVSYVEATAHWKRVRERMEETFATIPEAIIGHGLIKHPSAGKFGLVQGLGFIHWHVKHHQPQIRRTLASVHN